MIRDAEPNDGKWIAEFMVQHWHSTMIGGHGTLIDATRLPALIAGEREGLATYRIFGDDAELVSIDALRPGHGIGTALIEALVERLHGCKRLWVTTTNDNLPALRFYQRRGFQLIKVWPGSVDAARKTVKPSIAVFGQYGIAIRDELDLCRLIGDGAITLEPPWPLAPMTTTHEYRWKRFHTFIPTKTGGTGHDSWQRVVLLARAEGYEMIRYDSGPFREADKSEPFVITDADWQLLPTVNPAETPS